MVVNLCLPHFQTTVQCNKLCADGYDVTNLLSADPAVRRRGFKLEHFLRPPMQVTLQFGFQVEVVRVDVELWPWGMDRGQASKRLEISTSSEPLLPHTHSPEKRVPPGLRQGQSLAQGKGQQRDQQSLNRLPLQQSDQMDQSKGHQWDLQAKQWGLQDQSQHREQRWTQQRGHIQGQTDTDGGQAEFKLVGRCELRDDTRVFFSHPRPRPRPPFACTPSPPPAGCREEDLWSRGPLSLGSVTQLRVAVPFGGAASALGLKALAVWGLPARCCPPEEVERVRRVHQASLRPTPGPSHSASPASQPAQPLSTTATVASFSNIPEDFLDPLTQEVMSLPMLLPGGTSVDNATLEEYQRREATWGRPPNDPFTAVPFTPDSRPLPNPHLKSRIDRFLLQAGAGIREGVVGRQAEGDSPHPSRLIAPSSEETRSVGFPGDAVATESASRLRALCGNTGMTTAAVTQQETSGAVRAIQNQSKGADGTGSVRVENGSGSRMTDLHPVWGDEGVHTQDQGPKLGLGRKRDLGDDIIDPSTQSKAAPGSAVHWDKRQPEPKRARIDSNSAHSSGPSGSSHEQRLSASLDQALISALQGLPSFTSYPAPQQTHIAHPPHTPAGEDRCGVCCCSLSAYSTCLPAYRLPCGHFLCRPCLHRKSRPLSLVAPKHFLCPTCQCPAPSRDITRVHH